MDSTKCENSDEDDSENDLTIVTESPKSRKLKTIKIKREEQEVIETIGKELEEAIELKAAKRNLTTINVKHILKEVVSNEHVLALMQKADNPDIKLEFEPKFTRAKAKELQFSNSGPLSWLTPKKQVLSEVHKLITDELDEDSSGDEYMPGEESEDDHDSSILSESEIRSISPATPLQVPESPKDVTWTEDGIFKIPPIKPQSEQTQEEANIALRTRSKLSLSATPLEEIEEAFIPPDITTDMYDLHCDDEDWRDFLKKFTRPLDEIAKPTEDEDHDPEYNILADDSINESDTEELRADKAVKITKKELNALIAELIDATDLSKNQSLSMPNNNTSFVPEVGFNTFLQNPPSFDLTYVNDFSTIEPSCPIEYNLLMHVDQKLLLEQQMRQHVQMLIQNFLLTYQCPGLHGMAVKVKEFLANLFFLSGGKENSAFKAVNLDGALDLVKYWEEQFALNTDEVRLMKQHVCRVQQEAKQCWAAGTEYIITFPPLILKTISNSDVFIYPNLLPRIPFKTAKAYNPCSYFSHHEDELLAIGLEQFLPYLAEEQQNLNIKGDVKLKVASTMIVNYMMPAISINRVYSRIINLKNSRLGTNPVKFYFEHRKAPVTTHYVATLTEYGIVPPCRRSQEVLPIQWRNFVYPSTVRQETPLQHIAPANLTKISKPPSFNKYVKKKTPARSPLSTRCGNLKIPQQLFCSTPSSKSNSNLKKLEEYFNSPKSLKFKNDSLVSLKFNSTIFRRLENKTNKRNVMLPSMPVLGTDLNNIASTNEVDGDLSNLLVNENGNNETDINIIQEEEEVAEKEVGKSQTVPAIASLTVKSSGTGRKGLSGAQKKKAKLCREYNATLAMLTPEDPKVVQERARSYAEAYFEKARDILNAETYECFMEILNNFNDGTCKVADLYKEMEELLANKHQDLLDEFVTFLTSAQANDIGKLMLHYKLGNMSLFLHKLEIYFKDQPSHVHKIYQSLTELCTCVDITMDRVKNTILPLLRGNNLLVDWFLQIFPDEPPPKSLLNGPWELLDIKTDFKAHKDLFETVTVPDDDDSYGGLNCICNCHQGENTIFKSRIQHCIRCGLKFVQGRVYVPTAKGLRLANITFSGTSDVDHNSRIYCSNVKRGRSRCESSPSKQLTSPTKESLDEAKQLCDSEDEIDCSRKRVRGCRSPRKRKSKAIEKLEKIKKTEIPISNAAEQLESIPSVSTVNRVTFKDESEVAKEPEWDCNTSIESIELIKRTPEHSADSESEFCEESSQDNINTETDDTAEELESVCNSPVHSENSNSDTFTENMWTREEDKVILETFQKKGDKEEAFVSISNELPNRTLADIKDRFNTLMKILQKLISSESSILSNI